MRNAGGQTRFDVAKLFLTFEGFLQSFFGFFSQFYFNSQSSKAFFELFIGHFYLKAQLLIDGTQKFLMLVFFQHGVDHHANLLTVERFEYITVGISL